MLENYLNRYLYFYILTSLLMGLASLRYDIKFYSLTLGNISLMLYLIYSISCVFAIYKKDRVNSGLVLILIVSGILLAEGPWMLIPVILVEIIVQIKAYSVVVKLIDGLFLLISLVFLMIFLAFNPSGQGEDYKSYVLAEKAESYVLTMHDEGATGISFLLWREIYSNDLLSFRERIQYVDKEAEIKLLLKEE